MYECMYVVCMNVYMYVMCAISIQLYMCIECVDGRERGEGLNTFACMHTRKLTSDVNVSSINIKFISLFMLTRDKHHTCVSQNSFDFHHSETL